MDRVKRKRKKTGEKKVLLSIVDPWDVKVASVDPIGLAERRGVSLSVLPSNQDESASQEWSSTLGRSFKIPSPWYKPGTGSSDHVSSVKAEESTLIDPTWLDPSSRRSHVNRTCDSQSPNPSKERLRGNRQRIGGTRHDNEADEVDNGLIKAPQEISRDSFDNVDGTAVRVRFEIDGAEPKRNGVRCENGRQVDGAPRVLTKNPDANDNSRPERRPIAKQNRASGVNAEKKQESSLRRTDRGVEVSKDEKDTNDERDYSRIIEEKPAIVDIVQCLVESRYSPQTAAEKRAKRMPSCRRQETPKEIDLVGKTAGVLC